MPRRAAFLLVLPLILAIAATSALAAKPNFVLILADDYGYMDVGCNNPRTFYETPHLDALASSGMRFTSGYAACSVCSPTRYSIMTGKYPTRAGVTNFLGGNRTERFHPAPVSVGMSPDEVTLAEALKKQGYATFCGGKWHLGNGPELAPEKQGFDVVESGNPRGKGGAYDDPTGEHLATPLAAAAIKFMEQHRQQPFFVYLPFYSVHVPLRAPPALIEKYKAKASAQAGSGKAEFAEEEQVWPEGSGKREVRVVQNLPVYAAMVETMDTAIGKVLKSLEDLGLTENTVVVFTADNGGLSTAEGSPTSNLPLRAGKGWLYEGGTRVPVLIRAPGITKAGSTCDVPIVSTDYYPTFLALAGLDALPEQHLDGVNIEPLLAGKAKLDREGIFWHYPHYSNQGGMPGGAIRSAEWKLIERFEDGRVHLFNLTEDIGERTDLSEKNPERVAEMRKQLHAWYKDVGAKFLSAKENGPQPWRP